MILKLNAWLILIFLLAITNHRIVAQQLSQIYIVHPDVGDTIDNKEKIHYGLFPFYKKSEFKYGIFYLVNDTYVLSSKINDTIINRTFTSQEIQLVEKLIVPSPTEIQKTSHIYVKQTEDSTIKSPKVVISTSPLSIVNRINLSVETGISSKIAAGIIYTHFFASSFLFHAVNDASKGDIKGDRIQLFLRGYIGKKFNSFYLQLTGIVGNYSESNFYSRRDTFGFVTKTFSYVAYGGSFKLGRQWITGKRKNLLIDLNIGIQMCPRKLTEEIEIEGNKYYYKTLKLTAQPVTDKNPNLCSNFMIGWKF